MKAQFASAGSLRGVGALAQLGMYSVVAKSLPEESAGIMFFSITVVLFGTIVGRFGLDNIAIRRVAPLFQLGKYGEVWAALKKYSYTSLLVSILVFFCCLGVFEVLSEGCR